MIEIDTDVELFHPADRVWRALTERPLLATWFAEAAPAAGLVLRTAGLPGFDTDVAVQVRAQRAPELLVARLREDARQTLLTARLTATGHGCRLALHELLEQGTWDAEGRAEQHRQALTVRLPALLDWLAFQQVDLRREEDALTRELPVLRPRVGNGRRRVLLAAGLGCLALAGGAGLWAARPDPPPPARVPEAAPLRMPSVAAPTPVATPTRRPPATGRATPSASPTPTATPGRTRSPSAAPVALTARYETVADRVFGYRGELVVTNPGPTVGADWAATVTLGGGASVGTVNGAEWTQEGTRVTFTGATPAAGASVTVRFDVRDPDPLATAPRGCTIDGSPCAGL
ncbi:SRPBCC domain-containing protein [Micromonospora auratinigra]|uniref:Cellulose binding domain-containing protein n=1 Tax=Micromonospora auratinigra TaxID=261654 RepID=A0A1A8ZD95_9ACTN|nr:SRPBCC domain-containing protein [Micromonospora auratinigra]SBT41861.1 Cellulose binding domain-containing protein [Micromonospora auratinigra]